MLNLNTGLAPMNVLYRTTTVLAFTALPANTCCGRLLSGSAYFFPNFYRICTTNFYD